MHQIAPTHQPKQQQSQDEAFQICLQERNQQGSLRQLTHMHRLACFLCSPFVFLTWNHFDFEVKEITYCAETQKKQNGALVPTTTWQIHSIYPIQHLVRHDLRCDLTERMLMAHYLIKDLSGIMVSEVVQIAFLMSRY